MLRRPYRKNWAAASSWPRASSAVIARDPVGQSASDCRPACRAVGARVASSRRFMEAKLTPPAGRRRSPECSEKVSASATSTRHSACGRPGRWRAPARRGSRSASMAHEARLPVDLQGSSDWAGAGGFAARGRSAGCSILYRAASSNAVSGIPSQAAASRGRRGGLALRSCRSGSGPAGGHTASKRRPMLEQSGRMRAAGGAKNRGQAATRFLPQHMKAE